MSTMRNECLRLNKAIDLMHRKDTRLIKMHSKEGPEYFIVPGGRVRSDDARKILERPDVVAFDDGLFPGNSQTWHMVR